MKTLRIFLLTIVAMTLFNCNKNDSSENDTISVETLKSAFDTGKDFYLLDVRTQPEFIQGRLSFANDLIPYDSLSFCVDSLPKDKSTTIYLFCRSGRRSGISTTYLRSLGYINSYNVNGGIIAWQDAGYEIVSGN